MSKAILGTKLGMSQVFAENGDLVPVTVVEVLPNVVAGVKTVETDGYNAVQIGYGAVKEKHLTRPVKGQFEKPVLIRLNISVNTGWLKSRNTRWAKLWLLISSLLANSWT